MLEITLQNNKLIKKSNKLARMCFLSGADYKEASVWEGRIQQIVAAQVQPDDEEFQTYKIPIQFLLDTAGLQKSGKLNSRLKAIAIALKARNIEIQEINSSKWAIYSLFSACSYEEGSDYLVVRFDPGLKDYYLNIRNYFTTYALSEFMRLPNSYSQNLYEFLRSWDDKLNEEINVTTEYLHNKLNTPDSMRKNFAEFKRSAFLKACKDINKLTSLKFKHKFIKKGRQTIKVSFTITANGKSQYLEGIFKGLPEHTLAKIPEDQKDDLKNILNEIHKKYGVHGIRAYIGYTAQQHTIEPKKNWGAYINKLEQTNFYKKNRHEIEKCENALYDYPPPPPGAFNEWGPENIVQIEVWASNHHHEYHKRAVKWLEDHGYTAHAASLQERKHFKNELRQQPQTEKQTQSESKHGLEGKLNPELMMNALIGGSSADASIAELQCRAENGDVDAESIIKILKKDLLHKKDK